MKRLLCVFVSALMLLVFAGCQGQLPQNSPTPDLPGSTPQTSPQSTPEDEEDPVLTPAPSLVLTVDEYPRVDGSTANLPLMAAVLSRLTGLPQEDAEALTSCTTTPYAYEALINGVADLLLVYEPAEETKQKIEESGVALEMIPIGRDALVFIVNEQNPISGLTTEELQNIYTGKVSNWSELGGEDAEIVAFQRVSASGSQALFLKLLMAGLTPMEAPTELAPAEMGELIERLAEYNNAGNALGYSVFYYASYMYEKPGLKFLAVDGVTPTDETIADGSYPFLNDFYAVIRADEPAGSPARQIAEWLQTDEGKALIAEAGYVALP